MKQSLWWATLSLLFTFDALAACQVCRNEGTTNAECWVVSTSVAATYGACWEIVAYDEYGQVIAEFCHGGAPGSECTLPSQGGSGGGGTFDQGGSGEGECERGPTGACPAYCSSCP